MSNPLITMDGNLALATANEHSLPLLSLIVLIPAIGALVMPFVNQNERKDSNLPRNLAITFLLIDFILIIYVLTSAFDRNLGELQLIERVSWLPAIGLEWSLGIDGLSAPLVALSGLITLLSAAASWKIKNKVNLYFALGYSLLSNPLIYEM